MPKRPACALTALLVLAIGGAMPARAARHSFALAPGPVQMQLRAYSLGFIPIDGSFKRFAGTLELDDADPAFCMLSLTAQANSLEMPTQLMTDNALGPDLLDVAHYPTARFDGQCHGSALAGVLELHGVAKPLEMAVTVAVGRWTAVGQVHRAAWGMGAKPALAGPEVRITITAGLPANMRPASMHATP